MPPLLAIGSGGFLYLSATTHHRKEHMTNAANEALRKLRALQKYSCPQTHHAIQKILKKLHVQDYTDVVLAIEVPIEAPTSQPGGDL